MIYKKMKDAVEAAKDMCETLDTYVKITKAKDVYELFGTGDLILTVKE